VLYQGHQAAALMQSMALGPHKCGMRRHAKLSGTWSRPMFALLVTLKLASHPPILPLLFYPQSARCMGACNRCPDLS